MLEKSFADTLVGISGVAALELPVYKFPQMIIGGKTVNDLELAVLDLSLLSGIIGREIQGVVGQNFLSSYRLVINYEKGKILFE